MDEVERLQREVVALEEELTGLARLCDCTRSELPERIVTLTQYEREGYHAERPVTYPHEEDRHIW